MMIRTNRRRFPILIAAIAALALAMTLLFSPVQAQEGSAPDKPTGLSATASHDQVVLTWDDPGDASITGYVILRRVRVNNTGGEFSELVADTGTAATTYTDATVKANTTYTYRIKATNEHGVSERSRWFHIDIPAAPERPDQPTGLDATATHDQVVLTWDDPDDDSITGYVILRRIPGVDPQGHFNELVSNTGTDATTYTDDTVSAETRYTYRIKATNEHGVSERSRWFHIDTPAAPEAVEGDDPDGEDDDGAPGGPGKRANVSEPDGEDLPSDDTTTGEVDVGGSVTGNIGNGTDGDWFKVELEAGTRYQIDLEGADTSRGTLPDPRMGLYGNDALIGSYSNDEGVGNNSRRIYTPTAAGAYYVRAQNSNGSDTGTYTLSVRDITPPCTLNTGDIWCGVVTVAEVKTTADMLVGHGFADGAGLSAGSLAGNPDDTMFSVGDNDYTISAAYIQVPTGSTLTGTLFVLLSADLTEDDKAGLVLTVDDTTTPFEFSGATKGSTGLYSWGLSGLTWSAGDTVTVRLSPPTPDDFPADATTTGQVDVGGSVTGNIESVGDADWFLVELEETTRYQIDLEGAPTGRGTVSDPTINAVGDAGGNTITGTQNDDSGVGNNARTIFTATASGAHYVVAAAYQSTGTYTVSVIVLGANGASEAHADFPATTVEVGASVTGNIHADGNSDWFRVDLEAGKTYQIDLEGADTIKGTLADPYLSRRDGSGNLIENNDDNATNLNSQLVFTVTATGTYYLGESVRS